LAAGALRDDFRHEAFFYADQDEFLSGTASFLRAGLDADEAMLVVLSAPKIRALRAELDGSAERVTFADMAEVGANPARIIPAWREFVDRHAGSGRRLRGIGEPIWAARSPAELVECQRHESLLNLAFADTPGFYLLCPYDTAALDAHVLDEACRSHPHLVSDGAAARSDRYRDLELVAAPFDDPLPESAMRPDSRVFQAGTLVAMRQLVSGHARAAGLGSEAIQDLVLAVDEVATNSVIYGGGGGILRVWPEGDALICEVQDKGRIEDPLAGRREPAAGQPGGYGLWLANQLCDLVQVRTSPNGSAVRLHMRA
jgi:anti-sigma regulatory factor (Ser/Thr protein kinase)